MSSCLWRVVGMALFVADTGSSCSRGKGAHGHHVPNESIPRSRSDAAHEAAMKWIDESKFGNMARYGLGRSLWSR